MLVPLQDVYTEIANLVQQRVDEDEARGIPEAMVLRDNVDRKLVKQTVMTSVYGVTFVGARQQIGNRLKERGWEDERLVYKASCYGARVSLHHSIIPPGPDISGHSPVMQLSLSLRLLCLCCFIFIAAAAVVPAASVVAAAAFMICFTGLNMPFQATSNISL